MSHSTQAKLGIPAGVQRLQCGSRQLGDDGATLAELCACTAAHLGPGATVHLTFSLLGGKGGFGALLRGSGRAALTDNFDACRDLSGRRLRHVNAEKKLQEWAAEAQERQLEKVALQHLKQQEREAKRQEREQVCEHEREQAVRTCAQLVGMCVYEDV